jgi:hypothetical protein
MVACLLGSFASGRGYFEVHARGGSDRTFWREHLAKKGSSLEQAIEKERQITETIRLEVAEALPLLVPYLTHHETEVRAVMAEALVACQERGVEYLPLLRKALVDETHEETKQRIEKAIGQLEVL